VKHTGSAMGARAGGALFTPARIGTLEVRNRLVRSATAEKLCDPTGRPLPRLAQLYRELAAGGLGLLITGHAYVAPDGKCHPEMLGAYSDELVPDLAALAAAAHEGGAAIALQINHGGRQCRPEAVSQPVAPSAIMIPESQTVPVELDHEGIERIVAAFAHAARRARAARFDAVQIHAAHGYLGSQFLSPLTNKRTDAYGGSLPARARFLESVVAAVRAAVGEDFPVFIKLGATDCVPDGLTAPQGAQVAAWLEAWGLDAIEISTGGRGAIRTRIRRPSQEAYLLEPARAVRRQTKLPLMLVGGLRSRPVMEAVLAEGFDFISLSRPLICEPDLPRKLASAPDSTASCISCNRCWPETAGAGIACQRGAAERL